MTRSWLCASMLVAVMFAPGTAMAAVRVEVAAAVPSLQGSVRIDVILHTDGESVGGFQNDIVFDHNVVRLDSCRIDRAIGTTPFAEPGDVTCADDPNIGPCKTLSQSLTTCSGDPLPPGCPAETPDYSRFRGIVAGTEVFNTLPIPDGAVVYTCNFSIIDDAALPIRLYNANVVVSDPRGTRLEASGQDGGVCVDDMGNQVCAPLRPINGGCSIDLECESGHCDRCCDHQFNGICAPPRTPTPTAELTATRTPTATRTITSTRTVTATRPPTSTPIPALPGAPCDSACVPGFACNYDEGFLCCSSDRCPAGMSCRVDGLEGYCIRDVAPPAYHDAVFRFDRGRPDTRGVVVVAVSLQSNFGLIGGMQNDIIFDNTIVSLDDDDCLIEPAIGLFPFGDDGPSCLDDPSIGPCKNMAKAVTRCGSQPQPVVCPPDAADDTSVFRGIVVATAAPNNNPIPVGLVYSCSFHVLDANRLPSAFSYTNLVVSNPTGGRLTAVGVEYPRAPGTRCSAEQDCEPGSCVDGVCCAEATCPNGQSCAISGEEGTCAEKRAEGAGCNFASDCQSSNCDLIRESPFSEFRGVCGAPRLPLPHQPDCDDDGDCASDHCVDGFCCDVTACDSGQYCNTGECAPPSEPGAPCTADEQCALGLCVDGACCVTGACPAGESCSIATREGVCREPFRLGSECDAGLQCPTGFCTDSVCCESVSCSPGMRCDVSGEVGRCVVPPPFTPGEDSGGAKPSSTPTPQANGMFPTPTPPQPAPPPVDEFGSIEESGCTLAPRRTGVGVWWPLVAAGIPLLGRRRARRRDNLARAVLASALVCAAAPVAAQVEVDLIGLPGEPGRVVVGVLVRSNGASVGGMQADLLFDNSGVELAVTDCRIDASIGLYPLGPPPMITCLDDTSIGPCKNLSRSLSRCGPEPAQGCPSNATTLSVFRGIVAATAAPNNNAFPSESMVFQCRFRVIDPHALPLRVRLNNVVSSNPTGTRLDGVPGSGAVCVDEGGEVSCRPTPTAPTTTPTATITPMVESSCNSDGDCPTKNCDFSRPVPPSFLGSCGPTRTPTIPPFSTGCHGDHDCDAPLVCNIEEGHLCCEQHECPAGQTCRFPGHEGSCHPLPTPTPTPFANGVVCASGEECRSGNCVDDVCCVDAECEGSDRCDILGYEGRCAPSLDGGAHPCERNSDCAPGLWCVRNDEGIPVCTRLEITPIVEPTRSPTPVANPTPCSRPEMCLSGNCIDGVCCIEAECAGSDRCDILGYEGRCAPPLDEGDFCETNSDCAPGLYCMEAESQSVERCTRYHVFPTPNPPRTPLANPTPCSRPEMCVSGNCVDGVCCVEAECEGSDRCDILGYEGRCMPPFDTGEICETNSDCAPGLFCILAESVPRCTRIPPTPVFFPTRIPAAPADHGVARGSGDGCQLSSRSTRPQHLWPVVAAGLLLLLRRKRGLRARSGGAYRQGIEFPG